MSKRVLWLDNDPKYINVYASYLKDQPTPYEVTVVPTLTEAEKKLAEGTYDLLILDVMIPTKNAQEETTYPPEQTEHGLNTGLAFFVRHKEELEQAGTKVLVSTARIDLAIQEGFTRAGLPQAHMMTKPGLEGVQDFFEIVQDVLKEE